ncbi:MAG: hypothetical protein U0528_03225 [Anaerolineae bacterium]
MADIVKVARVAYPTVDEFKTMIKEIVEEDRGAGESTGKNHNPTWKVQPSVIPSTRS